VLKTSPDALGLAAEGTAEKPDGEPLRWNDHGEPEQDGPAFGGLFHGTLNARGKSGVAMAGLALPLLILDE
jgi:hypothetical protein